MRRSLRLPTLRCANAWRGGLRSCSAPTTRPAHPKPSGGAQPAATRASAVRIPADIFPHPTLGPEVRSWPSATVEVKTQSDAVRTVAPLPKLQLSEVERL